MSRGSHLVLVHLSKELDYQPKSVGALAEKYEVEPFAALVEDLRGRLADRG